MSVTRNIAATSVANLWGAVVGLAFVPVYIRYLGIEAWGLIGVYYTLLAIIALADLGLTATITRETARLAGRREAAADARDLVRTLELVYWGIGAIILVVTLALLPRLAGGWITPVGLTESALTTALALIAVALWAQWPTSMYAGGLFGLQQHVPLAALNVAAMTVRAVGAVAVLAWVSSTIQAFFVWHITASLIHTLATALLLWVRLPRAPGRAAFRWDVVRRVRGFAAGVGAVSVLGVVLTQLDKVLLSRLLTLDAFGYYMVASVVAATLLRVGQPLYDGVFPRLTQLAETEDRASLSTFYHGVCQVLGVLIIPPALILVLFPGETLFAWTGDTTLAAASGPVLALLALGMGMHTLLLAPWALQLAHRWTTLGLAQNAVAVLVLPPLVILLTLRWGPVGAAAAWVLLNIGYFAVGQLVMHRRILRGELARWYATGVVRPLAGAALVAVPVRLLLPELPGRGAAFAAVAITGMLTLGGAVLAAPMVRGRVVAALWDARAAAIRLQRRILLGGADG